MKRARWKLTACGLAFAILNGICDAQSDTAVVTPSATRHTALTESNRVIVERFVDLFYRQRNVRLAFERYVTDDYVQHNPNIADGREAAINALTPLFSAPGARFDVKRVLVDGDLAAVHLFGRSSEEGLGGAVVDLFRLKNGKIVEHWDVLQPIPTKAANAHPMF